MTAPRMRLLDDRVVMLLATSRDAALTGHVLAQAGLRSVACASVQELDAAIGEGVGAVLVCEEALSGGARGVLVRAVERQPPWSDLPVLVLTRSGADSPDVSDALYELGNVTLLERPLRLAALVSAVRTSLRARDRQYQIRDHLVQQERAREELAQIARRKDEFLAMLAHELRNPLAPIRNSLHLLGAGRLDPAAVENVRAMMERQVNHMVRLVDDLVDVSRISRGMVELRRQPADLSEVLRTAVEASAPLVAAGRHKLAVRVPEHPLIVDADPVRLAQVVGNLLNNAAKYSDPEGSIELVAQRDGDEAVIRVRDQGIGIEPAMLPQVFDLFTQGDRTQHRAQDGLGIGLTLVRTLVEMHGGRVVASSEGRGRGSEFVVRLPLAVAPYSGLPAAPSSDMPRPEAAAKPHLRVLVVDDNTDAADSLGMVLETLGVDHRIVYGGTDALRAVAEFEPAAVLLDIGMPGMDGYEVARRIRGEAGHQPELLVAVTGWGQAEDLRRSREAGFDHHINKPVDIDALKALLDGLHPRACGTATRMAAPSA